MSFSKKSLKAKIRLLNPYNKYFVSSFIFFLIWTAIRFIFTFFLKKKENDSKSLNNIIKVLLITGLVISKEIVFFGSVGNEILLMNE